MCRLAAEKLVAIPQEGSQTEDLEESVERVRLLVKCLTWQADFVWEQGRYGDARQIVQQAQAWLDDPILADQDTRSEEAGLLLCLAHLTENNEKTRALEEQITGQGHMLKRSACIKNV